MKSINDTDAANPFKNFRLHKHGKEGRGRSGGAWKEGPPKVRKPPVVTRITILANNIPAVRFLIICLPIIAITGPYGRFGIREEPDVPFSYGQE